MIGRDQRSSLLNILVAVKVDLPGWERLPPYDLSVEVRSGATVGDLTAELIQAFDLPAEHDYRIFLRLVGPGSPGHENVGAGYLPPGARLADCGLRDGITLYLRNSGRDPAPDLEIDTDHSAEDLFLIDERGTHRGRVTRLPLGIPVTIGANPGAGRVIIVDDRSVPDVALTVRNVSTSDFVECEVHDPRGLFLKGAPAADGVTSLLPGSSISFKADDLDRPDSVDVAGFVVTTAAGLIGRSPIGKVQFDVAARVDDPVYRELPGNLSSLAKAPAEPEEVPFPVEQAIIPAFMVLTLFVVSHNMLSLIGLPASVLLPAMSHIRQRRRARRRYDKDRDQWVQRLRDADVELSRLAGEEEGNLRVEAPPTEEWARRAIRRLAELWRRDPTRSDFLVVSVGTGTLPSRYEVALANDFDLTDKDFQEIVTPEGRDIGRGRIRPRLFDVPIRADLRDHHVGLVGPDDLVDQLATDLLVQVGCAHPPGSVGLAALLPASRQARVGYEWLKWLPHIQAGSTLMPRGRVLIGRADCNSFLRAMRPLLLDLKPKRGGQDHRDDPADSYALLVVHEAAEVDIALLSEVCELGGGMVRVLWLGTSKDNAPQLVTSLVRTNRDQQNELESTGEFLSGLPATFDDEAQDFQLNLFRNPPIRTARALAALYDPRASGASVGVPASVPLSAIVPVETPDYPARPRPMIGASLPVVVGVGEAGPLRIDLVRDGPHTLVGGTTGSGKSELLQTLVNALVGEYSPMEVSLFLVDFKGGATFAPFQELPHVVGYVSDLDQRNVNRALAFLRAEMRRRERLFAELDNAKEYADYLSRALERGREDILPRLVVVFDEFATIVQEFEKSAMPAVIDIAQRGRSVGLHLVLATQQPTRDVVVPKVRANVTLRIALRTLTGDDSQTIIERPDAGRVPRSLPGRALARFEGNTLVEFQTAFSGARYRPAAEHTPVVLREFDGTVTDALTSEAEPEAAGEPDTRTGPDGTASRHKPQKELDHLVRAIVDGGISRAPGAVALPAGLEETPRRSRPRPTGLDPVDPLVTGERSMAFAIGLRDMPRLQCQVPLSVDLRRGGVGVVGPNGSGRTESLILIAQAFIDHVADPGMPAAVTASVVAFDASDTLGTRLNDCFHYAVTIPLSRLDYVTRCVDQLWQVLRVRMRDGADASASTPILLLIDGYDVLAREFNAGALSPWIPKLADLLTLGRRYGLYTALASQAESDIDRTVRNSLGTWVRLHAQYEASEVGQDDRLPGFGLDAEDNLVQLYLAQIVDEEHATIQLEPDIARFLAQENWRDGIPTARVPAPGEVDLGTQEISRLPLRVNLAETHVLAVGGSGTGKTHLLLDLAHQLARSGPPVAVFRPRGGRGGNPDLLPISADEIRQLPTRDGDDIQKFFRERGVACLPDGRPVLLVDDCHLIAGLQEGGSINAKLEELFRQSQVHVVAAVGPQWAREGLPGKMKDSGVIVYLKPMLGASEIDDGFRVRGVNLKHRPGISYNRGDVLVQTEDGQLLVHRGLPGEGGRR